MKKLKVSLRNDEILSQIHSHVKNKKVLDVGCIEHRLENKNKDRIWVHDFLRNTCKEVTGIDIVKEDIIKLRKEGYNVYYSNAETFKLNKKFEVIFAGELIEHLSNPGLFLNKCKDHLEKDGILIITTPNAFSLKRIFNIILKYTNDPSVNKEHTCWFSPKVLKELLLRYNFLIFDIKYANYPQIRPKIFQRVTNFLCIFFRKKFKETIIIFAKKSNLQDIGK